MTSRPSTSFTNAKMIFLIAWVFLLLAWAWYDYSHGRNPVGAFIVLIITAVGAYLVKPWQRGHDE